MCMFLTSWDCVFYFVLVSDHEDHDDWRPFLPTDMISELEMSGRPVRGVYSSQKLVFYKPLFQGVEFFINND